MKKLALLFFTTVVISLAASAQEYKVVTVWNQ